jgi:hypothetical protein
VTFPPSDSPDWTGIPGALRFLGSIDLAGTGGLVQGDLDFAPASYDGAVYVIPTGDPQSTDHSARIALQAHTLLDDGHRLAGPR